MTASPARQHRPEAAPTRGCDWCSSPIVGPTERWEVRAFSYRSKPVGPAARRITTREDAGPRDACAGCAPLVRAGEVEQLATRHVLAAAVRGSATASVLPHAELAGLFRAVDAALVR